MLCLTKQTLVFFSLCVLCVCVRVFKINRTQQQQQHDSEVESISNFF